VSESTLSRPEFHALQRELERPRSLLAGRQMKQREVALLCHDAKWTGLRPLIVMVAIVGAESLYFTEAVGGPNPNGSFDYGAFQLNGSHAAGLGMSEAEFKAMAFDPVQAVLFARKLYVSASYSFRPWYAGPDGNKSYEKFMEKAINGVCNMEKERLGYGLVH